MKLGLSPGRTAVQLGEPSKYSSQERVDTVAGAADGGNFVVSVPQSQ